VVDGAQPDLVAEYQQVAVELAKCSKELAQRPRLLVVAKADSARVAQRFAEQGQALRRAAGREAFLVSSVTGAGLESMLDALLELVGKQAAPVATVVPVQAAPVARVAANAVQVAREGERFAVSCPPAERVARRVDLNDWRTRMQFHQLLGRLGVLQALERGGVQPGDMVRIGPVELEWQ